VSYVEGKGLFTKELEDALLDRRIDLAVHSVKDMGAVLPTGLELAAFPEREDPRDALVTDVSGGLDGLPRGARVGTSSLRRIAALRGQRPDIEIVPLRGNVPTRVARVERGDVAAVILAMAGLKRLGLVGKASPLDSTIFVPAPGQAALGIEIRSDDQRTRAAVAPLDDPEIRIGVEAERAAMAELEGGCRVPLGVTCVVTEGRRTLYARVYAADGSRSLSARVPVDPRDPRASGLRAARELLSAGAAELIRPPETMPPSPMLRGEQGDR
jgi:hydroxymethylbilane synthase